jgi:hypothetical protein
MVVLLFKNIYSYEEYQVTATAFTEQGVSKCGTPKGFYHSAFYSFG